MEKVGIIVKRISILIIIIMLCVGCSKKEETPFQAENPDTVTFEAMVVSKNGDSIMAIVMDEGKGFGQFDPVQIGYSNDLTVFRGDLIEIRFNGTIAESYPCQITANTIKVMKKADGNWPATGSIPENITVEEAINSNYFVMAHDKIESKDLLFKFIDNSKSGIVSFLRKVSYTTEGDPIITDFLFDGKKYYIYEDDTRDKFAGEVKLYQKEYLYMNNYEKDNYKVFYFADRNDITVTEYEKSMISSNSKDLIDTYPLYYEKSDSSKE